MSDPSPGLYLVTPVLTEAEPFLPTLREALASAAIASLLLRLGPLEDAQAARLVRAVAETAQAKGVALLIDGSPALALEAGADGAHVGGVGAPLNDAIKRLSPRYIVGAGGLATRDEAMTAGESGADYVLFGDDAAPLDAPALLDRVAWWARFSTRPASPSREASKRSGRSSPPARISSCSAIASGAMRADPPRRSPTRGAP